MAYGLLTTLCTLSNMNLYFHSLANENLNSQEIKANQFCFSLLSSLRSPICLGDDG